MTSQEGRYAAPQSDAPDDHVRTRRFEKPLQPPSSPDDPSASDERSSAPPHVAPVPSAPSPSVADEGLSTHQITLAQRASLSEGTLPPGSLLQDRYQILGIIKVGGMSTVYKARDLRFATVTRLCAVKEMVNRASDPQLREMAVEIFRREANILATTNHPAMPQIYDFFSESSRHYLVMELVDGCDLEDYLAELAPNELLDEAQVVDWALQLCDVLSYLHSHKPQPIVFRDLKPGNIMIDLQGRVRLIDFGIAKAFQTGQKHTMIGTEGYSPPEQYRGSAEPRGDVYALGATLHHLLSKQDPRLEPPFSFQERSISAKNPNVNPDLEAAIMQALEYEAEKRFPSVVEFQKAIVAGTRLGSVRLGHPSSYSFSVATGMGDIEEIWRFACEDEVRSSPRIKDGTLYVGAYDNNLYALNARKGEFVWKFATDGGIASTPCVFDEQVFFGSVDRIFRCINARTGRLEWTCPTQGRIWSSPSVEFGHVFFGSDDHFLYAVSVQSGRVAWRREMGGPIRSSVTVAGDLLYFGCEDGSVVAYDIRGEMKWRQRARRAVTSTPFLDPLEGLLFVGSMDWNVYALDAHSGWVVWRFRTSGPVISSPTLAHGVVFVGSADKHLYALDARTGREVWKYRTEGQVTSSPAFANGAVYFGSVDHYVYSLDAETGELRWRFKTAGPVPSSPIVESEVVYIGSTDRHVYAIPA